MSDKEPIPPMFLGDTTDEYDFSDGVYRKIKSYKVSRRFCDNYIKLSDDFYKLANSYAKLTESYNELIDDLIEKKIISANDEKDN